MPLNLVRLKSLFGGKTRSATVTVPAGERLYVIGDVHGHTITNQVEIKHNRIGIDAGAHTTGILTCLVLEANRRRLLQTGQWNTKATAIL